jgi:hypothetical protein
MAFVFSAIFMGNFLWGQLAIQIMFSIFMIIYLPWHRPLESKFALYMEVMNEETILILTYLLMCFTDFVPNPETRSEVGRAYMLVAITNIGIHLICLVVGTLVNIKNYFKKKCRKQKEIKIPPASLKTTILKTSVHTHTPIVTVRQNDLNIISEHSSSKEESSRARDFSHLILLPQEEDPSQSFSQVSFYGLPSEEEKE